MTTYLDLRELAIIQDDRYKKWQRDLFNAAESLRQALIVKLNLTTREFQYTDIISRTEITKPIITLVQPHTDSVDMNIDNFKEYIDDDGFLNFGMEINFKIKYSYSSFLLLLRVQFVDSETIYMSDFSQCINPYSKDKIAEEIIQSFSTALHFDPFSGKKNPTMGFIRNN
jgi:hypothetical protein